MVASSTGKENKSPRRENNHAAHRNVESQWPARRHASTPPPSTHPHPPHVQGWLRRGPVHAAFIHPAHQLVPARPTARVHGLSCQTGPRSSCNGQATSMPAQSCVVWVRQRQAPVAVVALSTSALCHFLIIHMRSQTARPKFLIVPISLRHFAGLVPTLLRLIHRECPSLGALGWWVLRACARRELVQCLSVSLHPPLWPSLLLRLGLCHSLVLAAALVPAHHSASKHLHTCMLRYHGRSPRPSPPVT